MIKLALGVAAVSLVIITLVVLNSPLGSSDCVKGQADPPRLSIEELSESGAAAGFATEFVPTLEAEAAQNTPELDFEGTPGDPSGLNQEEWFAGPAVGGVAELAEPDC